MSSKWQENLLLISNAMQVITTPARNLWHGRICFSSGLSGEDATWRYIAEHEPLARKPVVATDRSAPDLGLGRFFGDPSGFTLFKQLADAAFRCLIEGGLDTLKYPDDIRRHDLWVYWIDFIYKLAARTNNPAFLARPRHIHSVGEWVGKTAKGAYTVEFAFIERDLFSASVAAIHHILTNPQGRTRQAASAGQKQRRRSRPRPRWDEETRTLYLGDKEIKTYNRGPAKNQIDVIEAFHRADWRRAVDSPFKDPDKLGQTLRDLKKSLPERTLRFRADGTGEGIIWEYAT
jgi:hypothetical protein